MSETKSGLPVLLIASLCVNAALIGAVGAGFYSLKQAIPHHDRHQDPRRSGPADGPFEERLARSAFRSLDEDARREFRLSLAEAWRQSRGKRDEMSETYRVLIDLLSQDEIDRVAAEAAFVKIRESEVEMRARLHYRLLDMLERIPLEDRKALLASSAERMDRLDEWREKMRDGKDRRFDPPPSPPDAE